MRHGKICPKHETPCLSAQINTGNFAFVEMLSSDYANKCLNLNGILFLNSRIKVGRPKKYAGPFVVTKTWQEMTGDNATIDAVLDSDAEKVNRELFVGNTSKNRFVSFCSYRFPIITIDVSFYSCVILFSLYFSSRNDRSNVKRFFRYSNGASRS
jgi:hypothetical protein